MSGDHSGKNKHYATRRLFDTAHNCVRQTASSAQARNVSNLIDIRAANQ
jgi:hypothetical protein